MSEAESGPDSQVPPREEALRWSLLAARLFQIWCAAADAEIILARGEKRVPQHDRALAKLMEAARPTWPEEGRAKFVEVHVNSFRRLHSDLAVEAEIRRREYAPNDARIVERLLREASADTDSGGYHRAEAVIAGIIGRLYGPEQRAAYIVDTVLDPTLEDEESDEGILEAVEEFWRPPEMTLFEVRFTRILYNAGMLLLVLCGTFVVLSGGSIVGDLFRYGPHDYWQMTKVPGISTNREFRFFVWSVGGMLAGLLSLQTCRYLRGESRH